LLLRLPANRPAGEFADQVGVPVVAGVLLDHVKVDPLQGAAVYGLAGFDRLSAFWAEIRLALGPGSHESVEDERKSHFWDFACGLDCSVGHASSGLGLDFCGHDLSPVIALGGAGLAAERQPAELADSDEKARGSPRGHDQQIQAGEA
jgi:hypothetical protein